MDKLLSLFTRYRLQMLILTQALLPALVVVVAGMAFHEFVWMAILGNTVLNIGILSVGAAGTVLIVLRLVEAQREHLTLLRFGHEAQTGSDMKELLNSPWLSGRTVRRYLEHIAQTNGKLSSTLDQDAIENELHSISAEFESKMELPNYLVGFMVAMGLLGTFIGLLETLTGISGMLDGMSGAGGGAVEEEFIKLVGELRKPLAGMGIAFSASLFGLVGSLMLGMSLLAVRRYVRKLLADARTVLHELTERIRGPVGPVVAGAAMPRGQGGVSEAFLSDFMAELMGNINDLQDLFHRSQDASLQLSNRVDGLAQRLELVAQAIDSNVAAVKKTNDLLGFGPRMKETNEQMLAELRGIQTASTDQQRISARLVDVLNAIDQKLGAGNDTQRLYQDAQGNLGRDTLNKLDEAVGLLHSVNDRGSDAESKLDRKLQGLGTSTTNMASGLQGLAAKLGEVAMISQNQLQALSGAQQLARDANSEMLNALKDLGERIKKVEDADIGANRHLFEIKENIGTMNSSLEALETIAQGINRQSTLLEGTLEEMRTNQRNMTRDLQKQLREVARDAAREVVASAQGG
ncbi:MotA/TolQ/ExbB proton channel family protein [Magnetospirillum aberrantis]|uniref:Uncharacterized protein n=1 Tax=Magnetospirillum aberrantis SpK TaxID=908842 RepID=A0A7C9V097_9PROT|nr:MotA/TolQ/ExbB proton channel family protein [Magnetospirillum aberrantis]NFV81031.1 hypothetical protein [Magnetospirillum aberrantis SpK]